jgi:hypothetical protein
LSDLGILALLAPLALFLFRQINHLFDSGFQEDLNIATVVAYPRGKWLGCEHVKQVETSE